MARPKKYDPVPPILDKARTLKGLRSNVDDFLALELRERGLSELVDGGPEFKKIGKRARAFLHIGSPQDDVVLYEKLIAEIPEDKHHLLKKPKEQGEYADLNGVKLFADDDEADHNWCMGRGTMPRQIEITGMDHPEIVKLIELANSAGDKEFAKSEALKWAADSSVRARDEFVKSMTARFLDKIMTVEEARQREREWADKYAKLEADLHKALAENAYLKQLEDRFANLEATLKKQASSQPAH